MGKSVASGNVVKHEHDPEIGWLVALLTYLSYAVLILVIWIFFKSLF